MKSNWKEERLGSLVRFSSGGTPNKNNPDYWNGTIPWISAKNMKSEVIETSDLSITEEGLIHGSKIAPKGSLLLLVRGSGLFNGIPVCYLENAVAYNQDVKCIESTSELENKYLFYWLKANSGYLRKKIEFTSIGAGKFDTRFLSNLVVRFPDKVTRKKIIDIADNISDRININKKINENLLQQARALFRKWFSITSSGLYKLSDIADINPETYSPKENWSFVNYLDTSNITSGTINEVQYIIPSEGKLPSRARRILRKDDVVFSTVRPNQLHYGIISNPKPNMLGSTGFAVIRSKYETIPNEIIYLALTESAFVEQMQQLAEQSVSTFPSIRPADLDACVLPEPKEDDNNFMETIKSIFNAVAINNEENQRLATLRDTLLPRLMSGELDVSSLDF